MDTPVKRESAADLRDYLAGERTFLAWIRTGIALMGFGFLLAHFGVFAHESRLTLASGVQPHELSLWFGVALIAGGVAVNFFSARRYMRLVGALNRGRFVRHSVSKQGVAVAVFLGLLGVAITIDMILVLTQSPDALHAQSPAMSVGFL
jgi:putative membrane protein